MVVKTDPGKYLAKIAAQEVCPPVPCDAFYQCDCTIVHENLVPWKGNFPSAETCDPDC